ncbi:Flp pilus assembly protein CpaB [Arthrobacter sp. SLBN-122]|uniref:Flp pilus assembly protein CpaB n=1 Tax=Arthrobacter sp. SLBN-122 TaxID=2768455 RepID=UPI00115315EC|nr:Flp pilus assembly protein CpaB [Arthrobacter sp. SLBN-122]TQJ33287.1 pilus assembly protein CpaB [Arthrobacter sp. SLBN-122]
MKTRLLGGLAALLLAIVGSVLMFNYAQAADSRAQQGLDPIEVLVVQKAIPAGTPVADVAQFVKQTSLPGAAVPKEVVKSLSDFPGKITSVALEPGEQLLASRLVDPNALVAPGTVPVPQGMEELTLLLEPQRILGGQLKAGDTVGVYTSYKLDDAAAASAPVGNDVKGFKEFTKLAFQKVLVTSVQQAPAESSKKESNSTSDGPALPSGSVYVTLAREDVDAAQIVFASEFGKVWLSKENSDSKDGNPGVITLGKVSQ